MIAIGHCPLAMKRNLTKHVCVAVYELLTALLTLELALPEEEIQNMCIRRNINLKCSKT